MKYHHPCTGLQAQTRMMAPKPGDLFSGERTTAERVLLHDAMMKILRPLADDASANVMVDGVGKYVWNCIFFVRSYSQNIPERKHMSCLKLFIARRRPCVRCSVTMDDFFCR